MGNIVGTPHSYQHPSSTTQKYSVASVLSTPLSPNTLWHHPPKRRPLIRPHILAALERMITSYVKACETCHITHHNTTASEDVESQVSPGYDDVEGAANMEDGVSEEQSAVMHAVRTICKEFGLPRTSSRKIDVFLWEDTKEEAEDPSGATELARGYVHENVYYHVWFGKNAKWISNLERKGVNRMRRALSFLYGGAEKKIGAHYIEMPHTTKVQFCGLHFTVISLIPKISLQNELMHPPTRQSHVVATIGSSLYGYLKGNLPETQTTSTPRGWRLFYVEEGRLYSLGAYAWLQLMPEQMSTGELNDDKLSFTVVPIAWMALAASDPAIELLGGVVEHDDIKVISLVDDNNDAKDESELGAGDVVCTLLKQSIHDQTKTLCLESKDDVLPKSYRGLCFESIRNERLVVCAEDLLYLQHIIVSACCLLIELSLKDYVLLCKGKGMLVQPTVILAEIHAAMRIMLECKKDSEFVKSMIAVLQGRYSVHASVLAKTIEISNMFRHQIFNMVCTKLGLQVMREKVQAVLPQVKSWNDATLTDKNKLLENESSSQLVKRRLSRRKSSSASRGGVWESVLQLRSSVVLPTPKHLVDFIAIVRVVMLNATDQQQGLVEHIQRQIEDSTHELLRGTKPSVLCSLLVDVYLYLMLASSKYNPVLVEKAFVYVGQSCELRPKQYMVKVFSMAQRCNDAKQYAYTKAIVEHLVHWNGGAASRDLNWRVALLTLAANAELKLGNYTEALRMQGELMTYCETDAAALTTDAQVNGLLVCGLILKQMKKPVQALAAVNKAQVVVVAESNDQELEARVRKSLWKIQWDTKVFVAIWAQRWFRGKVARARLRSLRATWAAQQQTLSAVESHIRHGSEVAFVLGFSFLAAPFYTRRHSKAVRDSVIREANDVFRNIQRAWSSMLLSQRANDALFHSHVTATLLEVEEAFRFLLACHEKEQRMGLNVYYASIPQIVILEYQEKTFRLFVGCERLISYYVEIVRMNEIHLNHDWYHFIEDYNTMRSNEQFNRSACYFEELACSEAKIRSMYYLEALMTFEGEERVLIEFEAARFHKEVHAVRRIETWWYCMQQQSHIRRTTGHLVCTARQQHVNRMVLLEEEGIHRAALCHEGFIVLKCQMIMEHEECLLTTIAIIKNVINTYVQCECQQHETRNRVFIEETQPFVFQELFVDQYERAAVKIQRWFQKLYFSYKARAWRHTTKAMLLSVKDAEQNQRELIASSYFLDCMVHVLHPYMSAVHAYTVDAVSIEVKELTQRDELCRELTLDWLRLRVMRVLDVHEICFQIHEQEITMWGQFESTQASVRHEILVEENHDWVMMLHVFTVCTRELYHRESTLLECFREFQRYVEKEEIVLRFHLEHASHTYRRTISAIQISIIDMLQRQCVEREGLIESEEAAVKAEFEVWEDLVRRHTMNDEECSRQLLERQHTQILIRIELELQYCASMLEILHDQEHIHRCIHAKVFLREKRDILDNFMEHAVRIRGALMVHEYTQEGLEKWHAQSNARLTISQLAQTFETPRREFIQFLQVLDLDKLRWLQAEVKGRYDIEMMCEIGSRQIMDVGDRLHRAAMEESEAILLKQLLQRKMVLIQREEEDHRRDLGVVLCEAERTVLERMARQRRALLLYEASDRLALESHITAYRVRTSEVIQRFSLKANEAAMWSAFVRDCTSGALLLLQSMEEKHREDNIYLEERVAFRAISHCWDMNY